MSAASSRSFPSRYRARSTSWYCTTAFNESTHSRVSTGSGSFRIPMNVLLVKWRSTNHFVALNPHRVRSVGRQSPRMKQRFHMRTHRLTRRRQGSVSAAVRQWLDSSPSHLGDNLLCTGRHQARVRTDRYELKTLLDPLQRGLRRAVVNCGDHAVLLGSSEDVIDRLGDGRVNVVERGCAAQRQ